MFLKIVANCLKYIMPLLIAAFLIIMPMSSFAGEDTPCNAGEKDWCKQAYGSDKCCKDFESGSISCQKQCDTTPNERCRVECANKGCKGYEINPSTGKCVQCLSCCASGEESLPNAESCRQHCQGTYKYNSNTGCCKCTGESFDENSCRMYCTEDGKNYEWDPETFACVCRGEYIPTETACKAYCYTQGKAQGYKWDEVGKRCTCEGDPSEEENQGGPSFPMKLMVGIGKNRTANGIADYIGIVYRFATMIVGIVAIVMIIIGGVQYSMSAGNKAAIESAKETITSAIIGLVIVLLTYLILGTINSNLITLKDPEISDIDFGKAGVPPSTDCRWVA
ncbi:MAG: hypothetical protein ACD_63C00137G0004, partial [uncultured bacterium]